MPQTLCTTIHISKPPKAGNFTETDYADRRLRVWRMPSSSRTYPLLLEKKAAAYSNMFSTIISPTANNVTTELCPMTIKK